MPPNNTYHRVLANTQMLTIAILLLLGCTEKVHAQGRQIELLGRHTVGSRLTEVRSLRRSENCLIEGGNADCTFTDRNGVAYVVLGDAVTAVAVTEKTAGPRLRLPFGLKFGDSLDAAARSLVNGGRTWILGGDPNASTGVIP